MRPAIRSLDLQLLTTIDITGRERERERERKRDRERERYHLQIDKEQCKA
jgi:hypothetical protein